MRRRWTPKRLCLVLFVCVVTAIAAAQSPSPAADLVVGARVLMKMHDYWVGQIVERVGSNFKVEYVTYRRTYEWLPTERLIPLRAEWSVGEWALTDSMNEREFRLVQVIYELDGRYICIDRPYLEAQWRSYDTLVPLQYLEIVREHLAEHVTAERIAHAIAGGAPPAAATTGIETAGIETAAVEVEWAGRWYAAEVLASDGDKTLIHYSGYDESWDEWVGPERIRRRGGPDAPVWSVGDQPWSEFTNEGVYSQVLIIEYFAGEYLCLRLPQQDLRWKRVDELFVDRPEQTFFPGK